jgi:hypothetical protein
MDAVIEAQVSINSSEFYPAGVRFSSNVQHIISEDAVKPDPAWERTDSNGHFHAFAEGSRDGAPMLGRDRETPTLTRYSVHVECDGSCGGVCEGEGYDEPRWKCAICGDEVEPRFIADQEARTTGIPVVTSRSVTVTVQGYGPLPPIGQQENGDGTVTLSSGGEPARVTLRVRAGAGELVGVGYVGPVIWTYSRAAEVQWKVAVEGGPLLPRLGAPALQGAGR